MFGKKHLNINFADLNQQKKKKNACEDLKMYTKSHL